MMKELPTGSAAGEHDASADTRRLRIDKIKEERRKQMAEKAVAGGGGGGGGKSDKVVQGGKSDAGGVSSTLTTARRVGVRNAANKCRTELSAAAQMMTPQTVSPGMKVTATTQSNSHRPTSDHTQSSLTLTSSHQSSQLHVPSTVVPLPPALLEESSTVPLLPSCSDGDAATTTTHSSVPPLVASPAPLSPAVSSMGSPAPTSAPLSPAVPSSPVVKSKIPKRVVNSSSSSSTNTSPVHTLGSPARSCSSRTSDKASPSLLNGGVSPYASPSHELTPSSQRHYIKPIKPSLNNCSTPPHDISRLNTPTLTPTHQTTPSPLKPVESSLSEQRRNSFGFRSAEAKSNKSSNMNNSPNCEQTLKSSNKIVPGEKWASNASKSSPLKGLTRPAGEPVRKTQRSGLFSKPLNSSPSSIPCVQSKVESSGKVEKSSAVGTKPVPMECFGSPVAAQKPEKPTSLNLPVRTNTGAVHRSKNSDVVRPHQMQKENLLSSPLKKVEQPSPLKKVATNMSTGGSNSSHSGPSTISSMSYVSKSSSDDVCESNTANLCSVDTNKPHFKPFCSPVLEASDISSSTVHSKESQSPAQHTPSETNAPNKIFTQPHLKSPLTSATWNNKSVGKTTPLQSPNKTSGLAPLILESPSHSSVNKGPFATLMLGSPVKSPVCDHAAKDNNQSNATKDKLNRNTTSWSNGDSLTKDATAELSAKDVKDLSNSYAVAKEGSNGRPARPISFDLSLVTPPSLVSSLSPLTAAATLLINPLHPIPMSPTQSYIPISEPHQMTTSPIFPSTLPFLSKGSPQVTSLSPEVPLSPLKLTSPATSEVQSLLTSSPKHTTSKLASPVSGEVPSSPSHSIIASTTKPLDVLSPSNDSLKLTSPSPALVAEVLLSPTPNLITDSHLSPKDEQILNLTSTSNGSSTPSKEQPASVITSPSKVRPLSFLPSPTKRTREVILPSKPAAVAPSLPSPTRYELSTEMISIARRTGSPVVSPVSTVSHIPTSPVASPVATVSPSATSPVASPVAAVSPCVTSPVASPVDNVSPKDTFKPGRSEGFTLPKTELSEGYTSPLTSPIETSKTGLYEGLVNSGTPAAPVSTRGITFEDMTPSSTFPACQKGALPRYTSFSKVEVSKIVSPGTPEAPLSPLTSEVPLSLSSSSRDTSKVTFPSPLVSPSLRPSVLPLVMDPSNSTMKPVRSAITSPPISPTTSAPISPEILRRLQTAPVNKVVPEQDTTFKKDLTQFERTSEEKNSAIINEASVSRSELSVSERSSPNENSVTEEDFEKILQAEDTVAEVDDQFERIFQNQQDSSPAYDDDEIMIEKSLIQFQENISQNGVRDFAKQDFLLPSTSRNGGESSKSNNVDDSSSSSIEEPLERPHSSPAQEHRLSIGEYAMCESVSPLSSQSFRERSEVIRRKNSGERRGSTNNSDDPLAERRGSTNSFAEPLAERSSEEDGDGSSGESSEECDVDESRGESSVKEALFLDEGENSGEAVRDERELENKFELEQNGWSHRETNETETEAHSGGIGPNYGANGATKSRVFARKIVESNQANGHVCESQSRKVNQETPEKDIRKDQQKGYDSPLKYRSFFGHDDAGNTDKSTGAVGSKYNSPFTSSSSYRTEFAFNGRTNSENQDKEVDGKDAEVGIGDSSIDRSPKRTENNNNYVNSELTNVGHSLTNGRNGCRTNVDNCSGNMLRNSNRIDESRRDVWSTTNGSDRSQVRTMENQTHHVHQPVDSMTPPSHPKKTLTLADSVETLEFNVDESLNCSPSRRPILKKRSLSAAGVCEVTESTLPHALPTPERMRPILKKKSREDIFVEENGDGSEGNFISGVVEMKTQHRPCSILKKKSRESDSSRDMSRESSYEHVSSDGEIVEVRPILKKKSHESLDSNEDDAPQERVRPILKRRDNSTDISDTVSDYSEPNSPDRVRPILKRRSTSSSRSPSRRVSDASLDAEFDSLTETPEPEFRSILKRSSVEESGSVVFGSSASDYRCSELRRPILKKTSRDETSSPDVTTSPVPILKKSTEDISNDISFESPLHHNSAMSGSSSQSAGDILPSILKRKSLEERSTPVLFNGDYVRQGSPAGGQHGFRPILKRDTSMETEDERCAPRVKIISQDTSSHGACANETPTADASATTVGDRVRAACNQKTDSFSACVNNNDDKQAKASSRACANDRPMVEGSNKIWTPLDKPVAESVASESVAHEEEKTRPLSVLDRIRSLEASTGWNGHLRRTKSCRERYSTQPVTKGDISRIHENGEEVTKPSPSLGSGSSEERKAGLCTPEKAGSIEGGESEGVSGSSVSRGDRKILRKISTDRFRTQPVTLGEINSATTALLEPSGHLVSAKSPAGHLVSANSQGVQSPVGTLLTRSVDTEADNVWNERSPHHVNNFLSISCDTTLSPSLSSPVASDMLSSADSCSGVGGGLLARGGGPTGGIAARLAALQHNGQSAWRTRVQKEELVKNSTTSSIHQAQDLIRSQLTAAPTPTVELPRDGQAGSLAARLGKLESASHGWKKRVEASDARQFSVAGRMRVNSESADQETSTGTTTTTGSVSPDSPQQQQQGGLTPGQLLAERQRRTPRAERFKCKSANNIPHTLNSASGAGVTTTSSPSTHPTLTRSTSVPEDNTSTTPSTRLINGDARSADSSPLDNNIGDGAGERSYRRPFGQDIASTADEGPTVVVPRMDSDLDEFFVSRRSAEEVKERLEVRIEDFDSLVRSEQQLVNFKKPARVTRRPRGAASKNPIRALNERTDLIREEYTEVITGLADRELKRINIENLSLKNAHLAVEALAGLASKEDFAAVSLKSAASTPAPIPHHELLPYLPLMLLQVKGRRHVQTRLVEPTVTSVNRGDSYVLVTQTEVYHYTGQFANVIEKSRAAEIAQHILVQHDLGCNAANVHTISDTPCRWSRKFWKHLGASEEEAASLRGTEPGHPDEDELYEMSILDTNMIYELQTGGEDGPELVPLDKYWGGVPKIEMLDTNKILVFDFGSELYIWMGKNATLDRRKLAISLCKQLWVRGVDYTDCDISPLGSTNRCSGSRPAWCLLAKVTQHMESCLFREKFADWPDFSRVIRLREENGGQSKAIGGGGVDEIAALSGQSLLEMKQDEPDLVLEGTHLGRGVNFFHEELRKLNEIRTLDTKVWHIEEFETTALPQPSHGQFFSGDSYIIRWHYSVTITGRELSGQPSRHNIIGRDRFVYFIWQGAQASLNEQGAAALLTVQLDEERGPQVRISAGHEGPAFLNIFNGSYVCYEGKRSDLRTARTKGPWRLFTIRGSLLNEAQMLEVACSIRSLRSRACLLLVNVETGVCYLWQGARVSPHNLKVAHSTAQKFIARHPTELGTPPSTPLTLTPIQEGSEPGHFFAGLGTDAPGRALYLSLTGESTTPAGEEEFTPRLFSLSSTLGVFSASAVHSYIYNPELTVPYAYLQSDLYASSQPSLYLLDTGSELWLWQGWWPQDEAEEEPLDQQEQDSTDNISVSAADELVALNSDLVQGHRLGSRAHRWNAERRVAMETALSYWNTKYGGKINQAEEEEEGERGVAAYLVWAGLEPLAFTNLFQVWEDRDDVAEMNIRDGHKPGELLPITQELAKLTRSTYPPSELRQRPLPEGVDPTKLEVYLSADDFQQVLGLSRADFTELPVWKQSKMKQAAGLF